MKGAALAVAVALLPLALDQHGNASFIADLPLRGRLTPLPRKLFIGEYGTTIDGLYALSALIAAAAVAWALVRLHGERRRDELLLVALAASIVLVPVVLALVGVDYVFPRNMITVAVPALLAVGAGLAVARGPGIAAAAVLAAVGLGIDAQVAYNDRLQRDDWRAAATALGRPAEPRAVVVEPWFNDGALALYAGELPPFPAEGADVREVDVVLNQRRGGPGERHPPPGFADAGHVRGPTWLLVRYTAPAPVRLTPAQAAAAAPGSPAALIQTPTQETP